MHHTDKVRRTCWRIVCAGGYFAAGFHGTIGHSDAWNRIDAPNRYTFTVPDEGVGRQLGALYNFFVALPFWRLQPFSGVSGAAAVALAEPRKVYVVYLPRGGKVTVDLNAARGPLTAQWFNPRDGRAGDPFYVPADKPGRFQSSDDQDWVLQLRETSRQLVTIAPGLSIPPSPFRLGRWMTGGLAEYGVFRQAGSGTAVTDFHRNIFSYYTGAAQPEKDREQQLEDNTTKALVNTLEHSAPHVATGFLEWLGITTPRNVTCVQQKGTIGDQRIHSKSQRLLLAIVGTTNQRNETVCSQLPIPPVGDSRPDAWLYGEDFVVLLESKTGGATLDLNQMACHWHKLRPTRRPRIVTWADVHRFFTEVASGLSDTRSKWLVEQFTQYLEWTGMTEFVGFREEMFEFFVATERDPDTKNWVRAAVESLGDKVLAGKDGLKRFSKFYANKHVGNLAKESDHYWVAFGPDKFRDLAHQTISLYEQKLDVFVNVELLPPIEKLRRKIRDGGGFGQSYAAFQPHLPSGSRSERRPSSPGCSITTPLLT